MNEFKKNTNYKLKSYKKVGEFMFKYSGKDGILACLSFLQVATWVIAVLYFDELTVSQLCLLGIANIMLMATNYECIAHNFMHNPFFKWKPLNKLFSIMNSIAMGMPQTIYNSEHINHHMYTNDRWKDDNPPRDGTSTFYYGKDNQEENWFTYTFLAYSRISLKSQTKCAYKYSRNLVYVELLAIAIFFAWLLFSSPIAFLTFVIPAHYLGTCIASLENYVEHYSCDPENEKANSVSVYDRFYNFVWFNNGYHQEHHCEPKTHWTKIAELRSSMLPEDERIIVKGLHIMNLFTKSSDTKDTSSTNLT
jgi:fatty acid desaturase